MIMTIRSAFFLRGLRNSGKSLALKETVMSVIGRGTLAAALATAMTVVPAFAAKASPAAKPITPSTKNHIQQSKPDLIDQSVEYSEAHPVVVIGIAKGKKDNMTGERMGQILSDALMKVHNVPSKVFVEPGGDYTAVIFVVKGLIYGEYGLKESLSGMSLAAHSYNEVLRPRPLTGMQTAFASKPEPQQ